MKGYGDDVTITPAGTPYRNLVKDLTGVPLAGLQPEALIIYPGEKGGIQILSDDGTREIGGVSCKRAAPGQKRFRSVWITP